MVPPRILKELPEWERVQQALAEAGGRAAVHGVLGSAVAALVTELVGEIGRAAVVMVSSREEVQEMVDDLSEFCRVWGVDRLVAPYVSPDEVERTMPVMASEGLMKRAEVLRMILQEGSRCIIVTTPEALIPHLPSVEWWSDHSFRVKRGEMFPMTEFREWTDQHGYRRVSLVEGPGEWAQRGGVVDLFSWGAKHPFRVELEGDETSSLRMFDPMDQRSLEDKDEIVCSPMLQWSNEHSLSEYFLPETWLTMYEAELAGDVPADWSVLTLSISPPPPVNPQSAIRNPQFHWPVQPTEHLRGNLSAVEHAVEKWRAEGWRVWWVCKNEGERERLMEVFQEKGVLAGLSCQTPVMNLSGGFIWPLLKWVVLPDHEIFARYRTRAPKAVFRGRPLTDVAELRSGDVVVHRDYGVGRYLGPSRLKIEGALRDFISIEYAGGDKLHVPFDRFSVVQKYVGTGQEPALNALGTSGWERTKARVKERTREMAEGLIKLYAARQAEPGHAFGLDAVWQHEFEAAFPYQETPDQRGATDRIKREMEEPTATDHLLCGDVGYGKTEVAMRAAFKAATSGKQVAVLAPTTVLAEQHFETFKERMADYPIRIAMLSRFQKPAEQKRVVEAVKQGQVDILIGTHRLLSKDITFVNLGLLVVDEEQRFGVSHKERLKQMSRQVDVLTLTATPIPRTLQFALSGLRSLSVIETPPEGRLPVMTYVLGYDDQILREAIRRELNREGQVFYVQNRIEQLGHTADHLRGLVPDARVTIVHGQLPPSQLEQGMREFIKGKTQILLTTTIIEAGLDLPNVNTLIVERSERFGLAELYQLRGRVGRSRRQAYAYFTYERTLPLTPIARERLQAIAACQGLGGGMRIAMKDLELRGAGNLLGPEQHGQVAAVGFELYCQLLAEAIAELKGGPSEPRQETELDLPVDAYIPDEYAGDDQQKIRMYQQLVGVRTVAEAGKLLEEWRDRFGAPPLPASQLIELCELKMLAQGVGVIRIKMREGGGDLKVWSREGREWRVKGASTWRETSEILRGFLEKLSRKSF